MPDVFIRFCNVCNILLDKTDNTRWHCLVVKMMNGLNMFTYTVLYYEMSKLIL